MIKRLPLLLVLIVLLALPVLWIQTQDAPRTPAIDITGVNTTELPTVFINASVTDTLGQPTRGLGVADFTLSGTFADVGRVVDVQNVTDDNLNFATALVMDVSSSMAGEPFARAQEAAIAFVNAVGEQDPVALLTFANDVRLIVPPTTDKQALISAIQALGFGGETALYDGSVLGIETAVTANLPRRATIILSDGAEFGGNSLNPREAALTRAIALGVPVYTIGLGFGTDRTYLESLAESTNGRFYESPTPEELPQIYAELAALFRSQYVITVEADIPADGTEYTLGVQANTPEGATNIAQTTVRAPIPVPVVRAPESPSAPLTVPTTFTFEVLADDPLTSVTAQLGDAEAQPLDAAPYEVTVDPFTLEPNDYTLSVTAIDENGDSSASSVRFTVPPIPAQVSLDVDLAALGDIAEPVTFTVNSVGQTPTQRVVASVDGVEIGSAEGREFPAFTIDPATLAPGAHTLTVDVTSFSGAVATLEQAFSVAALPPVVRIEGLEDGANLFEPTTLTFAVDNSQTPVTNITFTAEGVTQSVDNPDGAVTFDLLPEFFTPAQTNTLTVQVTEASGQVTTLTRTFTFDISAYPTPTPTPTATFTPTATPDVAATEAAGTQAAVIAQTGTAVIVQATEAAVLATANAQSTLDAQATSDAIVVATADAQATLDTQATSDAIVVATQDAQSTLDAQATSDAIVVATQDAQSTLDAQATSDAQATNDAQATADTLNATGIAATQTADTALLATSDARATQNAVTTAVSQQTAEAEVASVATLDAQIRATNVAAAGLTAQAVTATRDAVLTATASALEVLAQTAEAANALTATDEAANALTATAEAANALTATADAANALTATADAANALTATADAANALTATADTDAALALTATDEAANALTATADADAALALTATDEAANALTATADANAALALTATDAAVQVAVLNAQATADSLATETADANARATQDAEDEANATATAQAAIALTEDAELIAMATEAVEGATATAQAALTLSVTPEPTPTNTPPFDPTVTPGGVTDIEAQGSAPTIDSGLALLLGGLGLLLLLVLLFLLLRRRNKTQKP